MAGLTETRVGVLLGKLHSSLVEFVRGMDSIVEENRSMSMSEIHALRDAVHARLTEDRDIEDKKRLLKLLDLFAKDRAVLSIIKEDAKSWLKLLDTIEETLARNERELTSDEKKEVQEIRRLSTEIRQLVRKG
ncbi:MAG: hypothetical protein KGH98_02190 [Candidatus Micrarchaeota archaeon]|nr:hypothetical protein [Candidatus Micrarchaeota archaeon]